MILLNCGRMSSSLIEIGGEREMEREKMLERVENVKVYNSRPDNNS